MEQAGGKTTEAKQRARVERLLHLMEEAWNRSDAEAYGALYTPDAIYVSRGGALWEGREEIEKQHAIAFQGPLRHTILAFGVWRVRLLSSKAAVVYAAVEITHPWNSGQLVQAIVTLVCVAAHDEWQIASAHTTDLV